MIAPPRSVTLTGGRAPPWVKRREVFLSPYSYLCSRAGEFEMKIVGETWWNSDDCRDNWKVLRIRPVRTFFSSDLARVQTRTVIWWDGAILVCSGDCVYRMIFWHHILVTRVRSSHGERTQIFHNDDFLLNVFSRSGVVHNDEADRLVRISQP